MQIQSIPNGKDAVLTCRIMQPGVGARCWRRPAWQGISVRVHNRDDYVPLYHQDDDDSNDYSGNALQTALRLPETT